MAAVVLVGIAALFVWDASRGDVIADGVSDRSGRRRRAVAQRSARARARAPAEAAATPRSSSPPTTGRSTLTAREARIHANLDVMVDDAVERGRSGGILARTWRAISGQEVGARARRRTSSTRAPPCSASSTACASPSTTRPSTPRSTSRRIPSRSARRGRAGRSTPRSCAADVQTALVSAVGDRTITAPIHTVEPEGHGRRSRQAVPRRPGRRSRQLPDQPLQEAQEGQGLPDRRRPGGPRDAGRPLQDPEQGDQSRLARPELRLGREAGGHGHPRRRAEQSAQGALAGRLRRRRRARHGRPRPDPDQTPRTAASGC